MKKIVFAVAVAITMSTAAMAQDGQRRERRQFNKTEMIQQRTDAVAKKYGLNDKQTKELLALNTEFADKMGPGQRGPRGGRPDAQRGNNGQRPEKRDTLRHRERPQNAPEGARPSREEMQKNLQAYDAKLQQILTADQYKAYKADQEKQRQQGPRGQRPHRNN